MSKLTTERCRQLISQLSFERDNHGMSNQKYDYLEALEIALPVLEQQERGEGWIEWKGGDCPVSSETEVEVRMRDGYVGIAPADTFRWKLAVRDQFPAADIIAYRVIENDGREG
ncbi:MULTISPECIES: hypothetical protein [Pantoea]|jgi:hypothetical protein|uniref:Uncharacterized protein n=2 Tax=root TaxID=1 RepID=A0A7Y6NFT8_9GAMM|nr:MULTISPECIES: hypothetical protein [Pantoea]DAE23039.1 MAG TPA: hypothetical protein [Siphoviridae sp. ct2u94]MBZ6396562.1 hypothetical protein [Pantoea sp.]MBZ6438363.1 hypothetical protein [Pantoea sp.]MDU7868875.1 hypothetical protein [Pantoea sp.]NUY42793.1 hypothetical protein [Pantoea brenneri]